MSARTTQETQRHISGRILLVDDNIAIHEDFRQILAPTPVRDAETSALESELFGSQAPVQAAAIAFEIDDAYQGEEAIAMVDAAEAEGRPYSLAFMDVRMPPGIDGIQTILRIWEKHPAIEMVICTAYSDYSWDQIVKTFGPTDHLFFMKKPFDAVSLKQVALTLVSRWKADRKTQNIVQDLQRTVNERTKELRDIAQHLKELKEQTQRATLARSQLLSSLGHEIKTPLSGIMGMSDLLLDTELDEDQQSFVRTIRDSGDSIAAIVDDLLSFTADDSWVPSLSVLEFNLRTTVENTAELIAVRARERGLEVVPMVHAAVPQTLFGDPEGVRQVLVMLAGSAVRRSDRGDVTLTVSVRKGPTPTVRSEGDRVATVIHFEITDDATPLAPEAAAQVFENRTASGEVNLYHAKRIVELMGGEIGLRSTPSGNTFWFTAVMQARERPSLRSLPRFKNLERARVLVVGDNPTSRRILSLYIEHWGGKATETASTTEAVEILQASLDSLAVYDLVVIDLREGGTQRFAEAAAVIRQHRNLTSIPLLAITAKPSRGEARALQDCGYAAYLTKPIKQTHLYNCIGILRQVREAGGPSSIVTKHLIDEIALDTYRFLVVETDPGGRRFLARHLQELGIRCDLADEADAACRAVVLHRYDLVIVGGGIAGGERAALLQRLRAEVQRFVPLVVVGPAGELGGVEVQAVIEPSADRRTLQALFASVLGKADGRRG